MLLANLPDNYLGYFFILSIHKSKCNKTDRPINALQERLSKESVSIQRNEFKKKEFA